MASSSVRVQLDILDTGAKACAEVEGAGVLQPFGAFEDLLGEVPEWPCYATLEEGRFVLNGSFVPLPDNLSAETWAVWGGQLSGAGGVFAVPIVLDFAFDSPRTCVGLTFVFDPAGDIAGDMMVQWFAQNGLELARMRVRPDNAEWFLKKRVQGFSRVVVTIYGTATEGRYIKLAGIEFGARRRFGPGQLLNARLVEQLDPTAASLPRGELEFSVFDSTEEFSLLAPGALAGGLSARQRVRCWGILPGCAAEVPLGTFYLSSWQAESEGRASFVAADVLGLLEHRPFLGGVYACTAATLCGDILQGVEYELEAPLCEKQVEGWLPVCTCRDALQQLAFALGAVVDTSRNGAVKLYRAAARPAGSIGYARKINGGSGVELKPLVTAVQVTGHRWIPGSEAELLYSGELPAGRQAISLPKPAADLFLGECTPGCGAELVKISANQGVVVLESPGNVELWGTPYRHYTSVAVLENPDAPTGAEENVLEITEATLVSPALAAEVAERLLAYHGKRFCQTARVQLLGESLADTVQVASLGGQALRGGIEMLEIDLTGGMLCDLQLCGEVVDILPWVYHCGELYTEAQGPGNAIF